TQTGTDTSRSTRSSPGSTTPSAPARERRARGRTCGEPGGSSAAQSDRRNLHRGMDRHRLSRARTVAHPELHVAARPERGVSPGATGTARSLRRLQRYSDRERLDVEPQVLAGAIRPGRDDTGAHAARLV